MSELHRWLHLLQAQQLVQANMPLELAAAAKKQAAKDAKSVRQALSGLKGQCKQLGERLGLDACMPAESHSLHGSLTLQLSSMQANFQSSVATRSFTIVVEHNVGSQLFVVCASRSGPLTGSEVVLGLTMQLELCDTSMLRFFLRLSDDSGYFLGQLQLAQLVHSLLSQPTTLSMRQHDCSLALCADGGLVWRLALSLAYEHESALRLRARPIARPLSESVTTPASETAAVVAAVPASSRPTRPAVVPRVAVSLHSVSPPPPTPPSPPPSPPPLPQVHVELVEEAAQDEQEHESQQQQQQQQEAPEMQEALNNSASTVQLLNWSQDFLDEQQQVPALPMAVAEERVTAFQQLAQAELHEPPVLMLSPTPTPTPPQQTACSSSANSIDSGALSLASTSASANSSLAESHASVDSGVKVQLQEEKSQPCGSSSSNASSFRRASADTSMLANKVPGRLIPLFFHQTCGANVQVEQDGLVASRVKSFCQGITFGSRPVQRNESVYIQLSQVSHNWTGTLRIGFSSQDPSTMQRQQLPESTVLLQLRYGAQFWSVSLPDRLTEQSKVLYFRLSDQGVLFLGLCDGEQREELNLLRVRNCPPPQTPLWPVFDLYGKALQLRLLGTAVQQMVPPNAPLMASQERRFSADTASQYQRKLLFPKTHLSALSDCDKQEQQASAETETETDSETEEKSNGVTQQEEQRSVVLKFSPVPGEATLRRRIGEMKKILLAQQQRIEALKQAAKLAQLQPQQFTELPRSADSEALLNDLVVEDYVTDVPQVVVHNCPAEKGSTASNCSTAAAHCADDDDTQEKTHLMMARSELKLTYQEAKLACEIEENLPVGGDLSFEDVVQAAQSCKNLQDSLAYLQFECQLCFDKVPRHRMVDIYLCNCKLCRNCFKSHFQIVIREKPLTRWNCPLCELPNDTDVEGIQEHLWWLSEALRNTIEKADYDLFTNKNAQWTMMRMHNFRWCSHCGNGFIYDGSEYKMRCPNCMKCTCFECGKPWQEQHEGISCVKFKEWKEKNDPDYQMQGLQKHLEENGIECPNCKFLYTLSRGGCLHFSCIQCQYQFCSGCGGAFAKGDKCGRGPACRHAGLHCHHPRNCFYYLRDRPVREMQELLRRHKVDYNSSVTLKASGTLSRPGNRERCGVLEQKETVQGLQDDICGRPIYEEVYAANLCEQHYKEYLVSLINKFAVDPAELLSVLQLEEQLHSANVAMARPLYLRLTDDGLPDEKHWSVRAFHAQLVKEVKHRLPLQRR